MIDRYTTAALAALQERPWLSAAELANDLFPATFDGDTHKANLALYAMECSGNALSHLGADGTRRFHALDEYPNIDALSAEALERFGESPEIPVTERAVAKRDAA